MIVNIEIAEEIVDENLSKKQMLKLLNEVINIVESRRQKIQEYLHVVDKVELQYQDRKQYLEKLILQLNDRDQCLNKGLNKIGSQRKELELRQIRIEEDLKCTRITAEKYLEKKKKSEQYYYSVISIPILSAQSKNKYIKARNKYSEVEQQISEIRQSLENCKNHLKLISKTITSQYNEQDQLSIQRRGSIDTIQSSIEQLNFLKQGYEFWSGFDSYQAQVVLESAIYLSSNINYSQSIKNNSLDLNQLWQKTFKLACFEYGDRESYGDRRWNIDTLEINYLCDMCQTDQKGWPTIVNSIDLACNICFTTVTDSEISKPLPNIPSRNSKMKKLFSSLFLHHHHNKINPM